MTSSKASRALLGRAGGEARLLVVEHEPTILELLSGSLRFAGFEVVTAASGAEALRAAAAARPDLILLDVMMPDGDGFEVIRQIRSGGPRTPVIFLTAPGAVHDLVAGLTLGGDNCIAGRVLGKAQILDHVWNRSFSGDGNVVESCVSYLRGKVDDGEPRRIDAARQSGSAMKRKKCPFRCSAYRPRWAGKAGHDAGP